MLRVILGGGITLVLSRGVAAAVNTLVPVCCKCTIVPLRFLGGAKVPDTVLSVKYKPERKEQHTFVFGNRFLCYWIY